MPDTSISAQRATGVCGDRQGIYEASHPLTNRTGQRAMHPPYQHFENAPGPPQMNNMIFLPRKYKAAGRFHFTGERVSRKNSPASGVQNDWTCR